MYSYLIVHVLISPARFFTALAAGLVVLGAVCAGVPLIYNRRNRRS